MKINLTARRPAIEANNLPDLVEAYIIDTKLRVQTHTAKSYDYLLSYLLIWWAGYGEAAHKAGTYSDTYHKWCKNATGEDPL